MGLTRGGEVTILEQTAQSDVLPLDIYMVVNPVPSELAAIGGFEAK